MSNVTLHELDTKVSAIQEWRNYLEKTDLPSIRNAVHVEIPQHYTKRIKESKDTMLLELSILIDQKLEQKFGWMKRISEGLIQAVIIATTLYFLGLGR